MMVGERLRATVSAGLPDGRQIDALIAELRAVVALVNKQMDMLVRQGHIVVELRAPIGPPLTLTIHLPKVQE